MSNKIYGEDIFQPWKLIQIDDRKKSHSGWNVDAKIQLSPHE